MAKREPDQLALPSRRELAVESAIMVAIGVALAALGPFGSYEMGGFARRLAYWLPLTLAGYLLFRPLLGLALGAAWRLDLPEWLALTAGVGIAAAPLSLLVLWWNGEGLGALPAFEPWFALYVNVALIGALITLLFWGIERASRGVAADPPPSLPESNGESPPASFLARLPPGFELLALEMEDHYVRAHGSERSLLILMRMRDAEAELAGVEGMRVHRSWWVARGAVSGRARDGRKLTLKLGNGLEVPVARDRMAGLRSKGWLD